MNDHPDHEPEPLWDTCAHGIIIDDYHWCTDCEDLAQMDRTSEDDFVPDFVPQRTQERMAEEEQENLELFLLQDQRKREAIRDGKRKACHHKHRGVEECWECEVEAATLEENLKHQQQQKQQQQPTRSNKRSRKPKVHHSLKKEEAPVNKPDPIVGEWLEKTFKSLIPDYRKTNKPPKKLPRQYSTTVEDPELDLQDFGVRPHSENPRAPRHGVETAINLLQVNQEQPTAAQRTQTTGSRITFTRVREDQKILIPRKKHESDAGYDLQSTETTKIPPGGMMLMKTGLSVNIPHGYFGLVKARSSLAITGISVEGGVIDSGYEGEIIAILTNRNPDRPVIIQAYDRIVQLIPIAILTGPMEGKKPQRSTKGFGSTGINAVHPKKITEFFDGKGVESKFAYNLGERLNHQQREEIHKLMRKFEPILATSFEDIKGSNLRHQHAIDTGDHRPIKINPYPMTAFKKEWVDREVEEMLRNGIISRSNSPWSFPIVVVAKKTVDGKSAPTPLHRLQQAERHHHQGRSPYPQDYGNPRANARQPWLLHLL